MSRSQAADAGRKAVAPRAPEPPARGPRIPSLEQLIEERDFTGAVVLLEHRRASEGRSSLADDLWLAYAHFHLTHFDEALSVYQGILANHPFLPSQPVAAGERRALLQASEGEKGKGKSKSRLLGNVFKSREAKDSKEEEAAMQPPAVQPPDWSREEVTLWMACCLLFLARDEEARTLLASLSAATRASPLALRVALVLRVKETGACSEEDAASLATQEPEDRICLAAVRCLLTDYEAAARELQRASEAASSGPDSPDLACLAVYLALVYHRLEYIEVSQQLLAPYLRSHADSTMAGNLFACNEMRLSKR